MAKKSYIFTQIIILFIMLTSTVFGQIDQNTISKKFLFGVNYDLLIVGGAPGLSKTSIKNPQHSDDELINFPLGRVSYINYSAKIGYLFTEEYSVYISFGQSKRGFDLKRDDYTYNPITGITSLSTSETKYWQNYYTIECNFRMLATEQKDWYLDIGAYYGFRNGDMSYKYDSDSGFSSSGIVKETDGISLHNDFGIIAGMGFFKPIFNNIFFEIGGKLVYGLYPTFSNKANSDGESSWDLYNFGVGVTVGITTLL